MSTMMQLPAAGANEIRERIMSAIPANLREEEWLEAVSSALNDLAADERALLREPVEQAIGQMEEAGASDLELGGWGTREKLWYRIHGVKRPADDTPWPRRPTEVSILSLLSQRQRETLLTRRNLDFSYTVERQDGALRVRGDTYFDMGAIALNMRLVANRIFPFNKLGFHPNIARHFSLQFVKRGLVLITGITGSGKSTTLDSIIDANNRTADAHIVIVSSPIEHVHTPQRCIVRHREVGSDVTSFKDGAIQALRQDPDIIMIGEIRDAETIATVLEVTDTGHKVFTTLHTSSAVESIDRIIAECPPEIQERVRHRLADVLEVVVSQKLPNSLDGRRVMAKEVLLVTASVRAAIKNGNTDEIYQMIFEGGELGMITMEQDLRRLVRTNQITVDIAMEYANNKNRMKELLQNAG